jgi:hypothetical protein
LFATIGAAAFCGAALAAGPEVVQANGPKPSNNTHAVKGWDGRILINYATGERTRGGGHARGGVIVYDNISTSTEFGYADFVGAEIGDDLGMDQGGTLDTLGFSIFNASEEGTDPLESMDVTIFFYQGFFEEIGNIFIDDLVFDPPLDPGFAVGVDITDLSEAGIVLPHHCVVSQLYDDVVGGADTLGQVLFDPPDLGYSSELFMIDLGWFYFPDGPSGNFYTQVGVIDEDGQKIMATSGGPHSVIFNNAQTFLGFSSGNLGSGFEQRWWAAPFILEGDTTATSVDVWWFIVAGSEFDNVHFIVWKRTNLDKPVDGDQVVEGDLGPFDDGVEPAGWLHIYSDLNIELPAGDYYFTMYGAGGDAPNNAPWLTGGGAQLEELERDGAWRSAQFPNPGFVDYAPASVQAPASMSDPEDRWNVCWTLRGSAGPSEPCAGFICGDSNGDGSVDFDDIDCFVQSLISQEAWADCGTAYGEDGYICANDINGDGSVDFNDIDGFVAALISGACE